MYKSLIYVLIAACKVGAEDGCTDEDIKWWGIKSLDWLEVKPGADFLHSPTEVILDYTIQSLWG